MKRILPYVLVLGLAIVVVVQYQKLQRLNPPETHQYPFRTDIDLDYHNPQTVGAYYDAGHRASAYALDVWANEGIHVLVPGEDVAEKDAATHYRALLANADALGARLARSWELKNAGFHNGEIARMEAQGLSPVQMEVERTFGKSILKRGDENQFVHVLQGLLIGMGYEMPHDGYYWQETETAVRAFQQKHKLLPSGAADQATLTQLLNQK